MELKDRVLKFIVLMGLVSLFGDMIYEGVRGISGIYLQSLGASMMVVSITAGLGEFLGYSVRLISGTLVDRLKAYWFFTFLGYGFLIFIPLLAFVDSLELAVLFILLERFGKGLRTPARDTIVSFVSQKVGRGVSFGIIKFFDQFGSIIGPLIFLISYSLFHNYKVGFFAMFIPFAMVVISLFMARKMFPNPEKLETPTLIENSNRIFYVYILFTFFSIVSMPNYQVISYFFKLSGVLNNEQIMVFYMLAMFFEMVVAIVIGKTYDIYKFKILTFLPVITFLLVIFSFNGYFYTAIISVLLYGTVLAIHESVMRSAVADLTKVSKRGFSYGIFTFIFGLGYFLGNVTIGFLSNKGYVYVVIFSGLTQFISLLLLIYLFQLTKKKA
jgi:MFS family permease